MTAHAEDVVPMVVACRLHAIDGAPVGSPGVMRVLGCC